MDKIRNQAIDNLMEVIARLDSADDCYDFFADLCTVKELQDMAQRFRACGACSRLEPQPQFWFETRIEPFL